jgi:hypothetical protein
MLMTRIHLKNGTVHIVDLHGQCSVSGDTAVLQQHLWSVSRNRDMQFMNIIKWPALTNWILLDVGLLLMNLNMVPSVFIQKTFGTCTSLCNFVKPLKVKKLQVSQAMSGFWKVHHMRITPWSHRLTTYYLDDQKFIHILPKHGLRLWASICLLLLLSSSLTTSDVLGQAGLKSSGLGWALMGLGCQNAEPGPLSGLGLAWA